VLERVKLTNESPAKQLLIKLIESKASALGIDKGNPVLRDVGNKGRDRLVWTLCTCHELLKVHDASSRGGLGVDTLELTPHERAIGLISAVRASGLMDSRMRPAAALASICHSQTCLALDKSGRRVCFGHDKSSSGSSALESNCQLRDMHVRQGEIVEGSAQISELGRVKCGSRATMVWCYNVSAWRAFTWTQLP
jgi:hypothetical protein